MSDPTARIGAPRGTYDVMPPRSWRRHEVVRLALDSFGRAGYAPIETPAFEHTELWVRGVGRSTEVVGKQMYTFEDGAGRSLTLRPEGTAPVVRAVLEHGLQRGPLPVKLSYAAHMFRQERPQKGRYRQHLQVGIEAIGSPGPVVDVEVIEVGKRFIADAGVQTTLLLNSIGHDDSSCRLGYVEVLVEFLRSSSAELAPDDRHRTESNPLRTFDSKEPETIATMQRAPLISDYLCPDCKRHFEQVQELLGDLGVDFILDPRLVRGLDYYTRTAFEFVVDELGSQNAVGGGGRYDGLSESLGGPPLPGIGFGLGVDRILLAAEGQRGTAPVASPISAYVVTLGDAAEREGLRLVTRLRRRGIGADVDLMGRGMKGQMKDAARSGARWAIILGDEELATRRATIKDLSSGQQEGVALDEVGRSWPP
jgi:histidyl-tRNA synthetase